MKKRLIKNKPNINDRGHYVYFNDLDVNYDDSNSLPKDPFPRDKFDKTDLYSTTRGDETNEQILNFKLVPVGKSFFKIDYVNIVNAGVKHRIHKAKVWISLFDQNRYKQQVDVVNTLLNTYPNLKSKHLIDEDVEEEILETFTNWYAAYGLQSFGYQVGSTLMKWFSDTYFDPNSTDPMNSGFKTLMMTIFPKWLIPLQVPFWELESAIDTFGIDHPLRDFRIYTSGANKTRKKEKDFGRILKKVTLMEDLGLAIPTTGYDEDFDPYNNFFIDSTGTPDVAGGWNTLVNPPELVLNGSPIMFDRDAGNQKVYIAVGMRGDASKWYGNDTRKKRIQVYEINSKDLFDSDGNGKLTDLTLKYSDSHRRTGHTVGGGAGAEAAAFKCDKMRIKIDTTFGLQNNPFVEYPEEITEMSSSVQPPVEIDDISFEEDYILQRNDQSVFNLYSNTITYDNDEISDLTSNFEPVAHIKPLSQNYDLQAYQTSSIDRQICSAPTQISLDFNISDYKYGNYELKPETHQSTSSDTLLGYKFYVVSWNDVDNKFNIADDYYDDIPDNISGIYKKQNENLYHFSDINTPLIHGYSTPGIKNIKAVLFSYTKTGHKQVVRWKFIQSKFFLDLPLTRYPDFSELGGSGYNAIPWPQTTPIIGGISENSKYIKSIKETLGSGKISEGELIDERILIEAKDNNELGQSILEFDLEQIRYFDKPYSIVELLDIPLLADGFTPHNDNYWDCNDWNGERNYCFPDESSVGQIFIGDNVDLNIKQNCKLELNSGKLTDKSIYDSSGNVNIGLLIGDYKVKKKEKQKPFVRESFIKIPKKNNNSDGAL